jgi:hypothetical protein
MQDWSAADWRIGVAHGLACEPGRTVEKVGFQAHPLSQLTLRKHFPDPAAAGFFVVFEA